MAPATLKVTIYAIVPFMAALLFGVSLIASDRWRGLIENLCAGALWSVFTIAVIDRLLDVAERRRQRPLRIAAYKEVTKIVGRFVGLWQEAVIASAASTIQSGQNLFDIQYRTQVDLHLDLQADAHVLPSQPWHQRIYENEREISALIDQTFGRYASSLDPYLLAELQRFEKAGWFAFARYFPTLVRLGQLGKTPNGMAKDPAVFEIASNLWALRNSFGKEFAKELGYTEDAPWITAGEIAHVGSARV